MEHGIRALYITSTRILVDATKLSNQPLASKKFRSDSPRYSDLRGQKYDEPDEPGVDTILRCGGQS